MDLADPTRLLTGVDPVALKVLNLDARLGLDVIVLGVLELEAGGEVSGVSVFAGSGEGRFWKAADIPLSVNRTERRDEDGRRVTTDLTLNGIDPKALGIVDCDEDGLPNVLALHGRSQIIENTTPPRVRSADVNPFLFHLQWDEQAEGFAIGLVNEPDDPSQPIEAVQLEHMQFGEGDISMALGDFDGDGRDDLAIVNKAEYTLRVFHNEGECRFAESQVFRSIGGPGSEPHVVVAGLLNRDNNLDLVVLNSGLLYEQSAAPAWVFLGRGDGTFRDPIRIETTANPFALVVEDFDNDGYGDVVVAGLTTMVFIPSTEQGRGTFRFEGKRRIVDLDLPPDVVPASLIAVDFNGDRNVDLALANPKPGAAGVNVYLNNGDGSFREVRVETKVKGGEVQPRVLDAGDLDGDGDVDLVAAGRGPDGGGEVLLLRNDLRFDGEGTFERVVRPVLGPGASSIAFGDLNGDGRKDLIAVHPRTGETKVYLQGGTGGPLSWTEESLIVRGLCQDSGLLPVFAAVTDLNGDGRDDLAVIDKDSSAVALLSRQQGQTPSWGCQGVFPVGRSPAVVLDIDVDTDGITDLVVVNTESDNISVLLGRDDGTCCQGRRQFQVGEHPVAAAWGDLDGTDGPDLVVANAGSADLSILLNDGDGGFTGIRVPLVVERTGEPIAPSAVVVGEFDGDPDRVADVVVASAETGAVYLLPGEGGGLFGKPLQLRLEPLEGQPLRVGAGTQAVLAGDLNGDALTDLIVAGGIGTQAVCLLSNQGGLRFHVRCLEEGEYLHLGPEDDGPQPRPLSHPMALALADLRGDGRKDLIVGTEFPPPGRPGLALIEDVIIERDGPPLPGRCRSPNGLAVGDFNGDGVDDIAGTCRVSIGQDREVSGVFRFLGKRDGSFEGPWILTLEGHRDPAAIITDHLNRSEDDFLDLALAHAGSNAVSLLLGQGAERGWTFALGRDLPADYVPVSLTSGHINDDDSLDLAVALQGSKALQVLCGDGHGGFEGCAEIRLEISPVALVAADFNEDGRSDLAVAALVGQDQDVVLIYLNDGRGAFTDDPTRLAVGRRPQGLVIGQLNPARDERLDLAVVSLHPRADPGNVVLFFGDGQGSFPVRAAFLLEGSPVAGTAGDFNGDGLLDLAVAKQGPDRVSVGLNDGTGDLRWLPSLPSGESPSAIAAGDFNADGYQDLVVANAESHDLTVFFGQGDGSFRRVELKL